MSDFDHLKGHDPVREEDARAGTQKQVPSDEPAVVVPEPVVAESAPVVVSDKK